MAEIPKDVIVAAAKASSPHFEDCDFGETWENCQDCRLAYDRAHYAVHAAAAAIRDTMRADVLREAADEAAREDLAVTALWLRGQARKIEAAAKVASSDA